MPRYVWTLLKILCHSETMTLTKAIQKGLLLLMISVILMAAWSFFPLQSQVDKGGVILEIKGPIGPATSDYIHRGLQTAQEKGVKIVILQLDTPGGLDTSMREIIQDILKSPIPIISYVAPQGARAVSAGTFIMYASHLTAMAPGTDLGAATPVQIGMPFGPEEKKPGKETQGKPKAGLEEKVLSDAIAYIKALADLHGRNKEWAVKFVAEAVSLSAEEALAAGVIEIVAKNYQDLLDQAEGRIVTVKGEKVTLHTQDIKLEKIEPDWRSKLLSIITNPNIAFFLLIIGLYGIIFEFINPGALAPGVFGTICLLVALYALHVLPINYAGLALILLGIGFIVAEAFMPSFGVLGIGGIIAFVIGAIMLMDTDVPGFQISFFFIAFMAVLSAGFLFLVASLALRSHRKPIIAGRESMIHKKGHVLEWKGNEGTVKVQGETWGAQSKGSLKKGDKIIVTHMDGLTLHIKDLQRED